MVILGGADYAATPQINDGLDVTVTGWILDTMYASPITTSLGTLTSTVSVDEGAAVAGPTPVEVSGTGSFTIVVPIATLQSSTPGMGGVLIVVSSTAAHARDWRIYLRPWLQAEHDAVETDRFIGGLSEDVQSPTMRDSLTGIYYSADVMQEIDGRWYHKDHGRQPKDVDGDE